MQNIILRVNVPYPDSDDEKKQLSGPLSYSISKGWYPHNLLFAALLAILIGWIFYMLRGVFGLYLLDFHNDNLSDACLILLAFIFFWSLLSFTSFILGLSKHRQELDKTHTPRSGVPVDIAVKPGMFYSILAIALYIVLIILDGIKNHPPQLVALAMLALLLFVCLWLRFRAHILALYPFRIMRHWTHERLQRIIQLRRARRTKTIGTSFATLTKYYPSRSKKSFRFSASSKQDGEPEYNHSLR